jgi:hypothetical protein
MRRRVGGLFKARVGSVVITYEPPKADVAAGVRVQTVSLGPRNWLPSR